MKTILAYYHRRKDGKVGFPSKIKARYLFRVRYGKAKDSKWHISNSRYNRNNYLIDRKYWGKVYLRYFRFRYSKVWGF